MRKGRPKVALTSACIWIPPRMRPCSASTNGFYLIAPNLNEKADGLTLTLSASAWSLGATRPARAVMLICRSSSTTPPTRAFTVAVIC